MKILYKQETNIEQASINIENCYLKKIMQKNRNSSTLKTHWHNSYEIHMIFTGEQHYETAHGIYELKENDYMIIPPKTKHRIVYTSESLVKYSATFSTTATLDFSALNGKLPEEVISGILFAEKEYELKKISSRQLIKNRVFEILILLFRASGYREAVSKTEDCHENYRIAMAKKFIADNIECGVSASSVAEFCHISPRHLSRLFIAATNITLTNYIRNIKMNEISNHLINSDLSLKELSEKFSYTDEYYFNTAFKKHFGIPPLAYRKMHRKDS